MVEASTPVVVAIVACIATTTAACLWIINRKKQLTGWVKVGDVSQLWLYPVKSCQGIKVFRAEATSVGLKYKYMRDRSFLVVDEAGKHINCRIRCPRLMCVWIEELHEETKDVAMELRAPGMDPFTLYVEDCKKELIPINIWESNLPAWDMGDDVAEWLHQFLEKESPSTKESLKYRLVLYDESAMAVRRSRDRKKDYIELAHPDDKILFSDFSSLHLICDSSLQDLNQKLAEAGEQPRTSSSFRNNIFIKNSNPPFTEDQWKFLKIGNAILRVVKPTQRCVLMTIDPKTGDKNLKFEPLKTLRKYRLATNKRDRMWYKDAPLMGLNLAVDQEGEMQVGDDVYAIM